jgi:hypothetical protein
LSENQEFHWEAPWIIENSSLLAAELELVDVLIEEIAFGRINPCGSINGAS